MTAAGLDGPSRGGRPPSATATRRADPVELGGLDDVTRPHRRGEEEADEGREVPPLGGRIGRFRILRQLGEGGMGLIFAAKDDKLDREVALKILRTRERGGALSRARMLREAQALGKLSHPNVVTVYEVGEHEGHVFIAMKLVEGKTLRDWLADLSAQGLSRGATSTWRTIVAVFVAAGRGLHAAHSAGITHRDFKPTNVIVGSNRAVTVLDFGIAIAPGRAETGPLTLAGTIAGTPPYMAPEQVAGAPVDPRADQYAFAACLYEALVGERPYKGKTLDERLRELLTEPPPSFPKGSRLPAWLQEAVLRGLAQDPDLRFPSMQEFIAAIEHDPKGPMRRGLLFGAAALALAAAGYALAYQQVAPPPICESGEAEIADAWDETRRASIEDALKAMELSYADDTLGRLVPLLDGYRDGWIEARRSACEANQRGELPTDLYGLEIACLDQRRRSFQALTAGLAEADAKTVEQALGATRKLPSLAACADVAALTSRTPRPQEPELRREVEAIELRLESVRVELSLARFADGLAELSAICERADELDFLPLRAEAHSLRGRTLLEGGDASGAEEALRPALWWADQLRDDPTLASTMAALLRALGEQAKLDEALTWTPHARSVLARLGDADPAAAELSRDLGWIHYRRRDAEGALRWLDQAKALALADPAPHDELLLSIDATRAAVLTLQGDAAASLEVATRVLEARIASLGPAHPSVAASLADVGDAHAAAGDHGSALPYLERALEIGEAALGPDHPSTGEHRSRLGSTLHSLGRTAEALPHLQRALEISVRRLGAEHPSVTAQEHQLGSLLTDLGHLDEARALIGRSHAKIAPDPEVHGISLASSLYALARVELLRGEGRAATRHLQRAVKLPIDEQRPDHREDAPLIKGLLATIYHRKRKTRRRGVKLGREALTQMRAASLAGTATASRYAPSIAELEAMLGEGQPPSAPAAATKTTRKTRTKRVNK